MGRFFAASLALASSFAAWGASPPNLAITHVNVVDTTGDADAAGHDGHRHRGGRIVELGKSGAVHSSRRRQDTCKAEGKYLIPGLWDMHVHEVFGDWLPRERESRTSAFCRERHHGSARHGRRSRRTQGVARGDPAGRLWAAHDHRRSHAGWSRPALSELRAGGERGGRARRWSTSSRLGASTSSRFSR